MIGNNTPAAQRQRGGHRVAGYYVNVEESATLTGEALRRRSRELQMQQLDILMEPLRHSASTCERSRRERVAFGCVAFRRNLGTQA